MPPTSLPPAADLIRAHQMFFAGVAAVLALVHLALYLFERRLRENLFCGLFAAGYGLFVYSNLSAGLDGATLMSARTSQASLAFTVACWLLTVQTAFGVSRPRLAGATVVAAAILGIWGLVAPGVAVAALLSTLASVVGVAVAIEIGLAWRAHRPGARMLGAGMALLASFAGYSVLRSFNLAPDASWAAFAPAYGGICAAISLSLFVAHNHAWLARRLEEKLAEVERLSREALANAEEKRLFIAAKNLELEFTVAERTAELRAEKGKVDDLLYNILPRDIADELKAHGRAQPRRHEDVTVLFTDFQGFTNTVGAMPADKLVTELNDIFNRFDDIMDRHGVQKIKTIGDAYMAAGGLPGQPPDGAGRIVAAALDMIACLAERNARSAVKWNMRLGAHSGIVVAGVMGKRRLIYDLFGDTVNIASRMESHGEPNRLNLSAYCYDLVRARYACDYLGKIEIKGKGTLDMYCVAGPIAPG